MPTIKSKLIPTNIPSILPSDQPSIKPTIQKIPNQPFSAQPILLSSNPSCKPVNKPSSNPVEYTYS
jgi:hypothetical protein